MAKIEEKGFTLTQKLIAIQQELKSKKDRKNEFGGFMFRSYEDILAAVKPLLKKHDVLLMLNDEVRMIGERFYMHSTAILSNGVETYKADGWAREPEHKTKSDDAQVTGMSSSYARKCALCGLFIIDNTDNEDYDMLDNSKEDAVDPIVEQIKSAKSIDELSDIWKANPQITGDQSYKELFSQRKHELQDGNKA
jgi:hypothetical protein